MCQTKIVPRSSGAAICNCGCCGCGPGFRRFFSNEEQLECLENYRDQLKKELAGIKERIKKCKCK